MGPTSPTCSGGVPRRKPPTMTSSSSGGGTTSTACRGSTSRPTSRGERALLWLVVLAAGGVGAWWVLTRPHDAPRMPVLAEPPNCVHVLLPGSVWLYDW